MTTRELTPSLIAQALIKYSGDRGKAADALGITYHAIMGWERAYEEIRYVREEARERLIDFAEDGLLTSVKANKWPAVQFVLTTVGRTRGYAPTLVVENTNVKGGSLYDLSDPSVRAAAIALADAVENTSSSNGAENNKGEVEVLPALNAPESQDSGDTREANQADRYNASSSRKE